MTLEEALLKLGLGITTGMLKDFLKNTFTGKSNITEAELKTAVNNFINICGANITSQKFIEFLANNGFINIKDSLIYANQSIIYQTDDFSNITIGENTESKTNKTSIRLGKGCSIKMGNNCAIVQNEDGSISFGTQKKID